VALTASKEEMREWFASRSVAPGSATHVDAQLLVDRLGGAAVLDQMYDDFVQLVASRPRTRTVPARRDDEDGTLRQLERVLVEEMSGKNAG
jgi:hypothetical protein